MRRAVFLDRDGVINLCPGEGKFVLKWSDFHLAPRAGELLASLKAAGFFLSLATNQSGIARGLMPLESVLDIHTRMQAALGAGALDAIYFCPHGPGAQCDCRKPLPGMILRACAEHGLDPRTSYMVGDQARDMECGNAAGCTTILCNGRAYGAKDQRPATQPKAVCATLDEAVATILREAGAAGKGARVSEK